MGKKWGGVDQCPACLKSVYPLNRVRRELGICVAGDVHWWFRSQGIRISLQTFLAQFSLVCFLPMFTNLFDYRSLQPIEKLSARGVSNARYSKTLIQA